MRQRTATTSRRRANGPPKNNRKQLIAGLALSCLTPACLMADALDASFLAQEVPPRVALGETYSVSVTLQNDGTEEWTGGGDFFLQAKNPNNNSNWGVARVYIPAGLTVEQDDLYTFEFDIVAPTTSGLTNFQWRMKRLGSVNFGDLTPNVPVDVGNPELEATFVLVSTPARLYEGEHTTIHLAVDNTGNTTWDASTQLMFQSAAPLNNIVWGVNRVYFDPEEPVQPGGRLRKSFEIVAPRKVEDTPIRWVVKQFGGGLYSEVSPEKSIDVLRFINGGLRFAPVVFNKHNTDAGTNLLNWYQEPGPIGWLSVREQTQAHLDQYAEATNLTHIFLALAAHKDLEWDDTFSFDNYDSLVLLIEDAYERGLGTMVEVGQPCTVPASEMPAIDDPYGRRSLCGYMRHDYVRHDNAPPTYIPFDIPFVPTVDNYIAEAKRFYGELINKLEADLREGAFNSMDFIVRGNHLNVFGAEIRLNHTDPYLDWTYAYYDALIPYLRWNTNASISMLTRIYAKLYADDQEAYYHFTELHDNHTELMDSLDYLFVTATSPIREDTSNPLPQEISNRLLEYNYKVALADFGLGGGEEPTPDIEKAVRILAQYQLIEEQGHNASFVIWSYQGEKNGLREVGQFGTSSEGWFPMSLSVVNDYMSQ